MPAPASPWTRGRLRAANLVVGLVHLAQAVVLLVLSTDFAITVVADYQQGPPGTTAFTREEVWDLAIAPAVALFLLLAAADHLLMAAPRVNGWYEANLDRGVNVARWLEYSVSASLMIVLIALLTGITNVYALVGIVGANVAMILFGWAGEAANRPDRRRTDWRPFWFGCVAGAAPWIAIAIALVGSERTGDVPGFVYGISVSLFVLFNCFAVNFWLQYRRVGPWRDYRVGEVAYIALSLTAKSALAWQVFGGTLAG